MGSEKPVDCRDPGAQPQPQRDHEIPPLQCVRGQLQMALQTTTALLPDLGCTLRPTPLCRLLSCGHTCHFPLGRKANTTI